MSTQSDAAGGDVWGDVDDDVALERYRALVEALDDGIYQLDRDGRFVAVNDVIVETTGYDREALLGSHVSLLLEEADVERIEHEIERGIASADGDVPVFELGVRTAAGETVTCELRITLLVEDGTFEGSIGVARPAPGRDASVTTLPSAQSTFDSITAVLDEADVGVFVLDSDARIAWANETIGEYFGFEREAVLGRDKRTVVDEQIAAVVEESSAFAQTVTATYEDNSYVEQFECHVTAGDGRRERWLEHRSEPIESGAYAGGRVELYYDVSDRKRAEQAHRTDREQFRSLVEATEEHAIFLLDADGDVVTWNPGASRIIGYDESEIVGEHVSTFYTDDDREAGTPAKNLARAAEEGSYAEECWRVRADGSLFWANVTISAIRDADGDLEGYAKVVHDMTDRKRARAERELLYETTRSIAGAERFEDGLRAALRDICAVTDWEYAEAWLPTEDGRLRRAGPDHHEEELAEFAAFSEGYTFEAGSGLPGRVFASGEYEWVTDLAEGSTETFPRAEEALAAGLRSALCVPVIAGEEVVGVLVFGMRRVREIDEDQVGLVSTVATEIGDLLARRRAEERHRRERDLVDRVFETAPIGIGVFGPDRTMTRANDRLYEIMGAATDGTEYAAGEMPLYDEDGELIPVAERPLNVAYDTGEAVFDRTVQVPRADGSTRWLSVDMTPLTDDDGTVTQVVATARDVTQLKSQAERLERRREELETELEDVFARVDDAFYALDEKLRFTYVNERAEELLQTPADELVGEMLWDVFPSAAEIDEVREAFDTAREDQESTSYELYYDTLDFWVEANLYPSESGISVYFRDVTERKTREAQLERYEQIVETLEEGIYFVDEDLRIQLVNEAYAELTGYDREELLGAHISTVVGEDVVEETRDRREIAKEDGSGGLTEVELRTASSDRLRVEARYAPLFDDAGAFRGTVGAIRDVTERRERERQLEEYRRWNRTLMEHFPNGAVALVDRDMRYVTFGGTPEGDTSVTRADLEGEALREVLPEQIAEVVVPRYEAALEGEPSEFEATIDGRTYQFHFVPVRDDDGEVFAAAAISQDVTEQTERERELEQSEQRYRTLVENFPNGIVALFDAEFRYLAVGGKLYDELPRSPDETVGKTLYERSTADEIERLEPHYEAALNGETNSFKYEWHGRVLQFWTVPVTDEDGNVFAGMAMTQDVTEQTEREAELREAKTQLEAATEAGAVGTWEWHVPADEFVTGASFAKTFGIDPADAREGVSIDRLLSSIHEADRDRVAGEIDEAVENCDEYEAEYRVRNADDELRWVVARGHVECDADGNAQTFPGALTDITERKRAELELEAQRRELETLFDVLPVGVVVADADGSLIRANDTAREIWGGDVFDADSVDDYGKFEAVWADSGEPVGTDDWTMSKVLDGEEVAEPNVYEIETFDGHRRIIMEHGMPVRDASGRVSRAVVTLTDISERKEYERKLEESNERLEQFAYAASHDLQEPLRMVTSYLQLIERRYTDQLDDDAEEFIEFAVDGADRMREMIDGLLEYSRVETRGDPFEPVDLEAVLEEVRDDLHIRITESGADVTAGDLPTVEGDASQLRQVFQNLLDNAIEYSGDAPPEIHVDAERRGDRWLVSVTDEGIGIDPEDAERVFDVFQRLHTNEDHPGTGIGLALCKRIVERHGGDIHVESEPGEGATFSFTLPAVDGASGV